MRVSGVREIDFNEKPDVSKEWNNYCYYALVLLSSNHFLRYEAIRNYEQRLYEYCESRINSRWYKIRKNLDFQTTRDKLSETFIETIDLIYKPWTT